MELISRKIDKILDVILFYGFEAYRKFKQILFETEHIELLKKVKDKEDSLLKEKGNNMIIISIYYNTRLFYC